MYFLFSNCTVRAKDPLLSRRRFVQRFPCSIIPKKIMKSNSPEALSLLSAVDFIPL